MADISKIKLPDGTTHDIHNTKYTFTSGTNSFKVSASDSTGIPQTVIVTPSIANNITGTGTSGYLAKFNSENTITNGVELGESTTTFLRNDGTWATPPDNNTTYSLTQNTSDGHKITLTPSSGTAQTITIPDNNTTYTLGTSGNNVTLTPSSGSAQSITVPYSTLSNTVNGVYTTNGGQQGPAYFGKNRAGFLMSNASVAGDSHFKNWLYMDNYSGTDVGGATAFGIDRTEPRAFIMQSDANRTSWNNTAALGVFTATPTSGQVVVTDGTTGGIKSSGYTIAKSVPSNAVFTDNNTTYTLSTSGNNVVLTPSSGSANTITVPYATNAGKVNNLTVQTAVPTNAKFTDTTYTFANGTNGFTVTPSGGTAQTVTVTPSITNNVTGSGTSGYLTKFNGAHTITNGPQLGSSTTTYLNNAGSWATPPDTKNTAGSTNTSSKIFLIGATSQAANPQTYSNSGVWVNGSGELSSHTWSVKNGNLYARAECYVDAEDGGRLNIYDENGIGRIMLIGNSGLTLNDSTDTTTIFLDSDNGRVECDKMSYTKGTITFSKSSGSWTFRDGEYTRSGQVVQIRIAFKGGSSNVSVGSNAIAGTIKGISTPPFTVRLQGYYSGTVLMGELTNSGGFNVRILGQALNLSSSNTATLSGTYIVED